MSQSPKALRIVSLDAANPNQPAQPVALFDEDGTSINVNAPTGALFTPLTTATAIGTAAKTIAEAEPAANTIVPIKFTNGNSANSPTVAFNGGSARAIQLGGVAATGAKCAIAATGIALFFFDGTILHQIGTMT